MLVRHLYICFPSFQSDRTLCTENSERTSRVYDDYTSVADTELVLERSTAISGATDIASQHTQSTNFTGNRQSSSVDKQFKADGMSLVWKYYKSKNISSRAARIIMSSWRTGTKKQYSTSIKKWFTSCRERQIDTFQVPVNIILDFLTELYENGLGYSAINTSRSALSALGIVQDGFAIGAHPVVIRFMKGIHNLRPSVPRYVTTWDVSKVLNYLKTLSPMKYLSLKLLTFKLVMLICLVLAGRTQTVHLLSIQGMRKENNCYILQYRDFLKQSRPGKTFSIATIKRYTVDRRLCCVTVLHEYLRRTRNLRGNNWFIYQIY